VIIYSPHRVERFSCVYRECGAKCCVEGRVVTAQGVKRISRATGKAPEEFAVLKPEKGLFRLKGKAGKCIFLRDDLSCELHELGVKPLSCRMYPFLFDGIIYADELVLKLRCAEDCPGIGRGDTLCEDFELRIEELGNQFVREIKDYLKESRKDEPE
jgi:Fe-S-cluster containining protein